MRKLFKPMRYVFKPNLLSYLLSWLRINEWLLLLFWVLEL
jgi:hypothetical protein